MKNVIKNLVVDQIKSQGGIVVRHTPKENIQALIQKLYPYKIDKELIRLGPDGDGGYLVPNDLENIEACFSPGVDKISDFEADCFKRGMEIFLADKSVDRPNLNLTSDKFHFLKKYVGCTNNDDFITMDEWVNSANISKNSDLLLQMDIESSEYVTFINMTDELVKRFRIIVIEFHRLGKLWDPNFFNIADTVFSKILQTHTCLHIHPNNYCGKEDFYGIEIPKVAEFTFIRNDRIKSKEFATEFPHKLDFENTNEKPMVLPKNWYKSK